MTAVHLPRFKLAILSEISISSMLFLKLQLCVQEDVWNKKIWSELKQAFFYGDSVFSQA